MSTLDAAVVSVPDDALLFDPARVLVVPPAAVRGEAVGPAAVLELTKPRITRMVTITSAVGFLMATLGSGGLGRAGSEGWSGWLSPAFLGSAAACLAGTALSASGANALNQWMERGRDARMPRTAHRPLPDGRVRPAVAFAAGFALCVVGVMVLLVGGGPAPALVSLATILSYLLVYTPLKPVTPLATIVGAVPGALPPLIGWTAAAGPAFDPALPWSRALSGLGGGSAGWAGVAGGVSLLVLMVVWQVPHFLAIAWMYREDYAKGGYRVLPVADPDDRWTARVILVWAAALLPATLAPAWAMPGVLGPVYLGVAGVTGLLYLGMAARLAVKRTRAEAKRVFFASIMHLPLLLVVMVVDGVLGGV